jgi:predicted NBD/HSP70 family sugar kinase
VIAPEGPSDNLLYLLLESGIGAGLLVHRELYRGGAGRVGESGHIRLPAADGSTGATVGQVIGQQAFRPMLAATPPGKTCSARSKPASPQPSSSETAGRPRSAG